VRWHPFFLNPDASKEGVNKIEMYNQKFGEQRVKQMIPMMTVGNCISCLYIEVTIVYKFSSIIITLLLLSS
jgi:predicted DsbA family dithiol-disulfide isomerase